MEERILLGNNAQFVKLPFEDFVQAQKDLGIREVELTLQAPHFYLDSYGYHDLTEVKAMLKDAGISVHSVIPLPYRYAICADEGTIQHEKTIGYYQQAVLLAAELGAKYLLITGSGANYDYAPERLMDSAEKTLRVLADFAGEHGVTLLLSSVLGEECIPNASTPVLVSMEEIRDMAERVNSEYLKVYLDTEVISLRGETITEWFETFGEDIRLVRFTDGNYNGYRIWSMGCFPCRKYLDEIGRTGFGGAFALTVPGERYADRPAEAMGENLQVLRQMMGQV